MDNNQPQDQDLGNKTNNSYLCRQSTTRWTPTSDQIRILKELYYNNGIRSPTADQIQRIAARLRHYGKIEGKNVFYWFQNHKARERQKKRFTPPAPPPTLPPSNTTTMLTSPFSDHHHHHHQHMQIQSHHLPYFYNNQPVKLHATHHISPSEGGGSSSSQVFLPVGCTYGAITMEKSFRDCSISQGENTVTGGEIRNLGSWVEVDSSCFDKMKSENENASCFDKMKSENENGEEADGEGELSTDIETLPLFPIPGGSTTTASGSQHDFFKMKEALSSEHSNGGLYTDVNWYHSDGRTSLELSLNSYGYYD